MTYRVIYNEVIRKTKLATLYRFEDGFCEWLANSVTNKYTDYIEVDDYIYNSKIKPIPHKLYNKQHNKQQEKTEHSQSKNFKVCIYRVIQERKKANLYFLDTGSLAWVPNDYCILHKDHIEIPEYIYNLIIKNKPHKLKIDRRTKEYKNRNMDKLI